MKTPEHKFQPFPKMARLFREAIITEKIDGTNASVHITEDGQVYAASRTRWITPEDDNFGFAAWVEEHKDELRDGLGIGSHFGEWWGRGIQRGYGMEHRHFSLFNALRWVESHREPGEIPTADPRTARMQERAPECCHVAPILWRGKLDTWSVEVALAALKGSGSLAAPGFMRPEGVVVFHVAGGVGFKATLENDDEPKGKTR